MRTYRGHGTRRFRRRRTRGLRRLRTMNGVVAVGGAGVASAVQAPPAVGQLYPQHRKRPSALDARDEDVYELTPLILRNIAPLVDCTVALTRCLIFVADGSPFPRHCGLVLASAACRAKNPPKARGSAYLTPFAIALSLGRHFYVSIVRFSIVILVFSDTICTPK